MSNPPRESDSPKIDSHHHLWDLSRFDYGWMPPGDSIIKRDYLPSDLEPLLEKNGIAATVLVQAHESVEEADWLLDLFAANDLIAGVVAWVDLASPDVSEVLDRLMARGGLVGIRHGAEHDPDQEWLTRDESIRGLREVAARGLAYDVLTRPHQLWQIPPLADRVPGLRMVVDHISKPPIATGEIEPWAADIAKVAAIPGVYCKLSGMVTEADHANWTPSDLKPYVKHILDVFGLDRLMFGSDWPVCLLAAKYDEVLAAALEAAGPLSAEDTARLLGGNAIDFYGLDITT
jgi:L-fuconolactonase